MYGEMLVEHEIRVASPRLRPARALATRTPAPAREPSGRASMVLFAGEGVPSPSPSPCDISHGTVDGMMPAEAWPGLAFLVLAPLLGISRLLPPPTGAGEERRRRGRGGGDRRAVYGEMLVEHELRVASPRRRPARALATRTPAPGREPYGRACTVLFAGEGVPSPSPSPGDIPHGTVGGMMPAKHTIRAGSPDRPSSCLRPCGGYRDYCPRPRGRGRSAEGAGGVGEIGERCMTRRR